jgi:hypothetical protein
MAVDTKIPLGEPGVASFASETFGNLGDIRYGDGSMETTNITITATGGALALPLYAVINAAGQLADWNATRDAGSASFVLAEPITMVQDAVMTVAVIRTGHLNMDVLTWDTSYDTDAKKAAAFEGSVSPTIFVSKSKFNSDSIY